MRRLETIIEMVGSYHPEDNLDLIGKAYVFTAKAHRGQVRRSGQPYLSHPMEVGGILADMKMDAITVTAGLLHDTVEDASIQIKELREIFGTHVADIVEGLTKISQIEFGSHQKRQAENFRKMVLAMAKDIRVIIVKLADRLHNMRTLEYLSPEKQRRIARETLDIYAPIADRLGIGWVKNELDDISLSYLDPQAYQEIAAHVASNFAAREEYIAKVTKIVSDELAKEGVPATISGRPKHFYSIYRKMHDQQISFDQVYDIVALRLITDEVKHCYASLGLIHSLWTPIPGRFKDFIAIPKSNLYRSLHTTVIGPEGKRVEFQIRTEEMHSIAENGIAAHWRYKQGSPADESIDPKFTWLRHLIEWQQDLKDPQEFLDTVKIDLFPDEVYVFTPRGEVKAFPRGATPIDFAYAVHTEIGNHCVGCKLNGRMVPLKSELKNGEIVEILTSSRHVPSKDWLKIVKTSRAKAKIRAWIKKEQKDRSIAFGWELCERELHRCGLSPAQTLKGKQGVELAKRFGFLTLDDLMGAIGYGKVSAKQVAAKLLAERAAEQPAGQENGQAEIAPKPQPAAAKKLGAPGGVKLDGIDNVFIRFARCCNPVPGDSIVGFITRGRGVTVHVHDCPTLLDEGVETERRVEVEWVQETSGERRPMKICAVTEDRTGILSEICSAISASQANITQANVATTEDNRAFHEFSVEITDLPHLRRVLDAIRKVKGVEWVERARTRPTRSRRALRSYLNRRQIKA
ncbi:MAG: bifunctional (p)ppGpp synthetase/guanosine-3',5'-bis(diphosphate) 3'-pyrophosphohydrolase [Candidatus Tectomicrobia bacterium]|nr:bifunctional (p)ppGpp synthetase/guanosine-3',5'-bis(diphosphate) 3'-pyrophosphohydrolase [Candidatus Tectomicrobia bacterium]